MGCESEAALSPVYSEALRLQADGFDHETIAEALGLTVQAVPALLLLAARKQARAGKSQNDADR